MLTANVIKKILIKNSLELPCKFVGFSNKKSKAVFNTNGQVTYQPAVDLGHLVGFTHYDNNNSCSLYLVFGTNKQLIISNSDNYSDIKLEPADEDFIFRIPPPHEHLRWEGD